MECKGCMSRQETKWESKWSAQGFFFPRLTLFVSLLTFPLLDWLDLGVKNSRQMDLLSWQQRRQIDKPCTPIFDIKCSRFHIPNLFIYHMVRLYLRLYTVYACSMPCHVRNGSCSGTVSKAYSRDFLGGNVIQTEGHLTQEGG